MEHYIWINPERLDQSSRKENIEGIDLTVELSPYDAPKGVVGKYDPRDGIFTIEFEYIDEEPSRAERGTEGIELRVGKHSGKLLKICVAIDHPPHDQAAIIALKTKVIDAIKAKSVANGFEAPGMMNRNAATRILQEDFEELTAAVAQ